MEEFLKIVKALNDKNRVRILKFLEQGTLCVCEIKGALDISTSTVSAHLSILKDAGFISDKKIGKWVYYEINRTSQNPILHQILAMLPAWLNNDSIIETDKLFLSSCSQKDLCC